MDEDGEDRDFNKFMQQIDRNFMTNEPADDESNHSEHHDSIISDDREDNKNG